MLDGFVPAVRERIRSAADEARKHPRDVEWLGSYGMVLEAHNCGALLVQMQREAETLDAFRRATELNPNHTDPHINCGVLLEETGDLTEAITQYRRAVQINPTHRLASYHLSRLLIGRGQAKEAIAQFLAILDPQGSDSADIYSGLANAYVRTGDLSQALDRTSRAFTLAKANHEDDMADRNGHDLHLLEQRLGH